MVMLKIEGDSAILHSGVTPELLALLPRLEGQRSWLKTGGLKIIPSKHNIEVLKGLRKFTVEHAGQEPVAEEADEFDPGRSGYAEKTESFPHQSVIPGRMGKKNVYALFMEQGTGKTKPTIDWAGRLFTTGQITGVIVVSKKGVHRQWIEGEVPKHLSVPWSGVFWPIKSPDQFPAVGLQWLAFNYDGLKTDGGLKMALAFAKRHQGRLLIIGDESQEIKNHRSARHKAMLKLRPYSSHRIILTGTPIAKDLTDEWAQINWLSDDIIGIKYLTTFQSEYCILGGFTGRNVVGHRNVDRFKALVAPYVYRVTKQQIGMLPKQYADWKFDLTAVQKKHFADLKADMKTAMADGTFVKMTLQSQFMNKAQQVSCGFIMDQGGVAHRLMPVGSNPRVIAAMEWLGAKDGKAIIWAVFKEDMRILHEALTDAGEAFVEYHGGVSEKARPEAIRSFMDPDGARVLLANAQSAGTGLNLQGQCNRALYYSNSFRAIDRWQSEDRIHRIGTNGLVTYTDLIAIKSPDSYISRNLKQKKGFSDLVLDDFKQILDEF